MSRAHSGPDEMAGSTLDQYCSISKAMKLVQQPSDGDKRKLKEFTDNVSTTFELVRPEQHGLLLKSVKTKRKGEARSKLLAHYLTSTWQEVKQILEENYKIKRTFGFLCLLHVQQQAGHA
jgi:hypothetical protein